MTIDYKFSGVVGVFLSAGDNRDRVNMSAKRVFAARDLEFTGGRGASPPPTGIGDPGFVCLVFIGC